MHSTNNVEAAVINERNLLAEEINLAKLNRAQSFRHSVNFFNIEMLKYVVSATVLQFMFILFLTMCSVTPVIRER